MSLNVLENIGSSLNLLIWHNYRTKYLTITFWFVEQNSQHFSVAVWTENFRTHAAHGYVMKSLTCMSKKGHKHGPWKSGANCHRFSSTLRISVVQGSALGCGNISNIPDGGDAVPQSSDTLSLRHMTPVISRVRWGCGAHLIPLWANADHSGNTEINKYRGFCWHRELNQLAKGSRSCSREGRAVDLPPSLAAECSIASAVLCDSIQRSGTGTK